MKLVIFEDDLYRNLFPLTMTRATFELRCGYTTLREKILRKYPEVDVVYFLRDYLIPTFKLRVQTGFVNEMDLLKKDDCLLINGRLLVEGEAPSLEGEDEVGVHDGQIVYARASRETVKKCFSEDFSQFMKNLKEKVEVKEVEANLITYPWNLITNNAKAIEEDFKALKKKGVFGKVSPKAEILGSEDNVYIAETAVIQPYVVLDATEGPIIIDEGVRVAPFTHIEGPSAIGKNSRIFSGARIHEGVSMGPVSWVGGELEESIIHGYSNKIHTGFLGHSYLGEWVNIGASTVTSDLKNDYSTVQVFVNGELMDTGELKVGSFIGDHSKTSIGCLLNTGTVIGVMSNVLASVGPTPKYIPSFVWYFRDRFSRGEGLRRMLRTAEVVKGRRGETMTDEERQLYRKLYEMTREERETIIKRSRARLRRKLGRV